MTIQFKDGFATSSGNITIYRTDLNNIYVGSETCYISRGCGLPAQSYLDQPPPNKDGFVIVRHGDAWEYLADHRGEKLYSTIDGSLIFINELGDYPENTTTQAPPGEYHYWTGEMWKLDEQKKNAALILKKSSLINNVDEVASKIASHWTRFSDEYYEREEAAKAFAQANFEGEPSTWITGFAQPAGLDNKTATQLILKQAEQLKSKLAQLGALRMRKYELKQADLTLEQLQSIHDDIVSKIQQLSEEPS